MIAISNPVMTVMPAHTNKMQGAIALSMGVAKVPADVDFYFTLTLTNVVVGSRYRVTRDSTGDELATGVAAASTVTLTGLPSYGSSMLVDITVRNASGSPNYKPFNTAAYSARAGAGAYILQQLDE